MTSDVIVTERHGEDGNVALLRLNRPDARNAVNLELAVAICAAVTDAQDAAAIVITGSDPAFCAGLDLRNLGIEDMAALPPFVNAPATSSVPVIAAVNGAAVTGGLELALSCDFIIASERARFADTHLRVHVYPGPVLVDLPRRVGMAWARQMSLTGDFVDAGTALNIGLANEVVPHDELVPRALTLAAAVAEQDRAMVALMRADWDATANLEVHAARETHLETSRRHATGGTNASTLREHADVVFDRSRSQRTDDAR